MAKKIVKFNEIEDALKDFSKKDKINEKNPKQRVKSTKTLWIKTFLLYNIHRGIEKGLE